MLYEALRPIARIALTWYYRSITVAGADRLPAAGPLFLAVNHPNALVDALVVACSVERRVRFTAKATLFANPLAARFFRAVGAVPLRRASDEKIAGGKIAGDGIAGVNDSVNSSVNSSVNTA